MDQDPMDTEQGHSAEAEKESAVGRQRLLFDEASPTRSPHARVTNTNTNNTSSPPTTPSSPPPQPTTRITGRALRLIFLLFTSLVAKKLRTSSTKQIILSNKNKFKRREAVIHNMYDIWSLHSCVFLSFFLSKHTNKRVSKRAKANKQAS